ncbi:hypothetical protein ALNOE001_01530 [Candidatus Methanobinarius endosymbioticus]|uniref:Uncharacterized protein n=1 Tax=Candidatus Methanobinarius endosymbioticus TaxID=2006182 RepID=A0A366ME10_9EURY|nr:hypothetical protein ALNOE001_01530 [Candidatus Methanobinarius endosymbioticus]
MIVVGAVAGGFVANNYLSDQNQNDGLNFNSSNSFRKNGFKTSDNSKNIGITQNNNLKMNNKITVINIVIVEMWYQYIEVIGIKNNINFHDLGSDSISVSQSITAGVHTFNLSEGTMSYSGYANNNGSFYSSEIYKTSDGSYFGIMVITNPNGIAEELANELANEDNFSVSKDTLKK